MTTAAQQTLIDSISWALEDDAGIEAAWLAGSLGRGTGDAYSDVDILVLCGDGKAAEISSAYGRDVSRIAQPILANALFGGRVLNVVTSDWQRFDLTFIEGAQLALYNRAQLRPLFNRGEREPPVSQAAPYRTTPAQLKKLVDEFLRVLGLGVVVVGREEYALALSGIEHLRRMTFDLMLEENGIGPHDRGGALHLNPLLTPEQRQQLSVLPPLAANRESVIEGHLAFARLFLPQARKLASQSGMAWPELLESATRAHLKAHWDVETW
jgi:predicted nucleotidyltransferase